MTDNRDIVRRAVEAWNRNDVEAAPTDAAADFEIDWSRSIGPYKGVYRGHGEVRRFWEAFWEAWEEVHWEPDELLTVGPDEVIVVNRIRGRGRGSGIEIDAALFVCDQDDPTEPSPLLSATMPVEGRLEYEP